LVQDIQEGLSFSIKLIHLENGQYGGHLGILSPEIFAMMTLMRVVNALMTVSGQNLIYRFFHL
jgi:hypothetical protein